MGCAEGLRDRVTARIPSLAILWSQIRVRIFHALGQVSYKLVADEASHVRQAGHRNSISIRVYFGNARP